MYRKAGRGRKVTRSKCKCYLNCLKNVSEADQSLIFSEYWDIRDIDRQREYLLKLLVVSEVKTQFPH